MQDRTGCRLTRVGIVSTEPIRLAGLSSALENHDGVNAIAGDLHTLLGDSALCYLILDLSSEPAWLETQSMVRRMRPDIRQIVLGPAGNDDLVMLSIAAGARAYLDSNSGPHAVGLAVEAVIQGSIWAPRRILSKLIDRLLSQQQTVSIPAATPVFSPRERQVLNLIMTACSNREIAGELGIEERTVKAYVASLMRKTGAENRVSLSVRATRESLREQQLLST